MISFGQTIFFLLLFDTVKGCWLVFIAFPQWSKFTMHYAGIWSRIISDKLVDGDRTEREREREGEVVTL